MTVTKKGTASGYIEQDLTYSVGQSQGLPCDSPKVRVHGKGRLSDREARAPSRASRSASPSRRTPCSIAGSERLP